MLDAVSIGMWAVKLCSTQTKSSTSWKWGAC